MRLVLAASSRRPVWPQGAAPLLALAAMTLLASGARASDGPYLAAVKQARAICLRASPRDQQAAAAAISALRQGTGESQLEVVRDLGMDPPGFADAARRLLAVEQALARQAASPRDGARADSELRSILSEPRFQANGPSLFDRAKAWFLGQLARLLLVAAGGSGGIARLLEFAVAVAVGVGIAVFLARSLWSRRGSASATSIVRAKPREAVDWFAEADRLAAAGNFPAALRALTSGVATALGGQGAWETSPLTVRELLVRSARDDLEPPLLIPFEASTYGHRPTDAAIYARAAEVAAPYRAVSPP
jgi:hypothetical protein